MLFGLCLFFICVEDEVVEEGVGVLCYFNYFF